MEEVKGKRRASTGQCGGCRAVFPKAAMTRHLASCLGRPAASKRSKRGRVLHLVVEGRHAPHYWLHLEAPITATFDALDYVLRTTWLECCGHLSAFTIERRRFASDRELDLEEESMDRPLGEVLAVGTKLRYEYDFGTTTELALRVVAERDDEIGRQPIRLLARNEPPAFSCQSCGTAATRVCGDCQWSAGGWLCGACARKHRCGSDMLLPVVNSPRVGMCAYTG